MQVLPKQNKKQQNTLVDFLFCFSLLPSEKNNDHTSSQQNRKEIVQTRTNICLCLTFNILELNLLLVLLYPNLMKSDI